MFEKQLSTKLLKIIDERNLTLESVADASGLTYCFISNITRGTQVPGLISLEKLCSALEVTPNDLLISEKSIKGEKSKPMRVNTVYCHREGNVYSYIPVCPCCNSLLQNEWQSYCDFCEQRLSWERYVDSNLTFEKPKIKQP